MLRIVSKTGFVSAGMLQGVGFQICTSTLRVPVVVTLKQNKEWVNLLSLFYSCQWRAHQKGFLEKTGQFLAQELEHEEKRADLPHQPVECPGYADFWSKLVRPGAVIQPLSSTIFNTLLDRPNAIRSTKNARNFALPSNIIKSRLFFDPLCNLIGGVDNLYGGLSSRHLNLYVQQHL